MAFEPINIFSHRVDPAGVLAIARRLGIDVRVEGAQDSWTRLEIVVEKRWLRSDRVLVVTHDPAYYGGDGWPRQLQGMQNYFRRFEGDYLRVGFTRTEIMRLIGGFRFSLAFPNEDLDIHSTDSRLDIIFALAEHLEGAIFTPSALRDVKGRALIGEGGPDPAAVLPSAAMLPNVVGSSGEENVQAGDIAPSRSADGPLEVAADVTPPDEGRRDAAEPEGVEVGLAHEDLGLEHGQEHEERGEFENSSHSGEGGGADEEDFEPAPPTSKRAAKRLIALAAVAGRAFLELNGGDEQDRQTLLAWLATVDLGDELEPWEIDVLAQPLGALSERATINAMWRIEGLAVLAWAFELHEIAADDAISDPAKLFDDVGVLQPEAAQWLLTSGRLRPVEQLHAAAAHYVMLHWRLREFSLRGVPMNFVKFSEDCWFGSFDVNQYELAGDDLAIDGEPIAWAPAESVNRATSVTMERHHAANWLCGAAEIYSETDTST